MTRRARLQTEPLADWPYPDATLVGSPFDTPWTTTRDELLREADHLGAELVVLELDCARRDIRQDGEVRATARLTSGRVRVTMDTRHGSMRWALERYDEAGQSWAHNVRAIVRTLEALRAVERYGAVADGQQYRGFLQLEAPSPTSTANEGGSGLDTATGARAWLAAKTGMAGVASLADMLRMVRARARESDAAVSSEWREQLAQVERTLTGAGSAG